MYRWIALVFICSVFMYEYGAYESYMMSQMPVPAGGIDVFEGHREGEGLGDRRRAWWASMHKAAPDVNWKSLDRNDRWKLSSQRSGTQKTKESFGSGTVDAEWIERGSLNQAGSLNNIEFDEDNERIYGISAGGTLWSSDLAGSDWTPLNEALQFETAILGLQENGSDLIIHCAIGKQLYRSLDNGSTWLPASGLNFNDSWGFPKSIEVKDNGEVYYLAFTWDATAGDSRMWLFYSNDYGQNYTRIQVFDHSINYWDARNQTSMWSHEDISKVYFVHLGNEVYHAENGLINIVTSTANLPTNASLALEGAFTSGVINDRLYCMTDQQQIYSSTNGGANWSMIGSLPTSAWEGKFGVNEYNSSQMAYGEVEFYRSQNTASSFTRANTWGSYYSNIDRIHADIMDIDYFKRTDGSEFGLVANHGGLHISYDGMQSFTNIGKQGLNIAQYYDVRTDPKDIDYIYGGTQDQGHHRTNLGDGYTAVDFDQVISGDYGHMSFSNNGQALWTVYPGGWITYYPNAQTGGYQSSYDIDGANEAAYGWISPTAETTDPTDNVILAAGGNITGGSGSYLIKLTAQTSSPYTITASQYSYDFRANSNDGSSTISAVENDPLDADNIYVSTEDGTFFYSDDAGVSWNKSNSFSGPGPWYLYGSSILASKIASGKLWYGGSGYSNPAVYQSTDGGVSFTPMSNGLPGTLVYDLAANQDESLLFAGTELGPYMYVVALGQWFPISGNAAPMQQYVSVEFIDSENTARFGTHGRGIWDFIIDKDCEIYNQSSAAILQNTNVDVIQTITSSSVIGDNKNVNFNAGEYILLEPNFETKSNVSFHAYIDGCVD